MNIYPYLRSYQSVLLVYPTQIAAHEAFLSSHSSQLPRDLADVEFIYQRQSIVRANPASRTPTAVVFVSYTQDPETFRGMSAPVELIDSYAFKDWRQRERWQEFKLTQERHRHAQPG